MAPDAAGDRTSIDFSHRTGALGELNGFSSSVAVRSPEPFGATYDVVSPAVCWLGLRSGRGIEGWTARSCIAGTCIWRGSLSTLPPGGMVRVAAPLNETGRLDPAKIAPPRCRHPTAAFPIATGEVPYVLSRRRR